MRQFILSLLSFLRNLVLGGLLPTVGLWMDAKDFLKEIVGGSVMAFPHVPLWVYYTLIAFGLFLGVFIPYHRQRLLLARKTRLSFNADDPSCVLNITRLSGQKPEIEEKEERPSKLYCVKVQNLSKGITLAGVKVVLEDIETQRSAFKSTPMRCRLDSSEDGFRSQEGFNLSPDGTLYFKIVEVSVWDKATNSEQFLLYYASKSPNMIPAGKHIVKLRAYCNGGHPSKALRLAVYRREDNLMPAIEIIGNGQKNKKGQ